MVVGPLPFSPCASNVLGRACRKGMLDDPREGRSSVKLQVVSPVCDCMCICVCAIEEIIGLKAFSAWWWLYQRKRGIFVKATLGWCVPGKRSYVRHSRARGTNKDEAVETTPSA